MRFPFKQVAFAQPFISLGGGTLRPRPIVVVSLTGPSGTYPQEARIDSGSDDSLFPLQVASTIGVDLSNAIVENHQTQGGVRLTVRFAQITLRLTDGIEFREWPAWVGFVANLHRPVLGIAGVLQYFTTSLFGDDEEVELTINRLYPGM